MDLVSATVLTFGLKVFQEIGVANSLVFSPIALLLAGAQHEAVINMFEIDQDQMSKIAEVADNLFNPGKHRVLSSTHFGALWKYRYNKVSNPPMKFHTTNGTIIPLAYSSYDEALNGKLVSDRIGFRFSENDFFYALEIPLFGKSVCLIIFLPKEEYTLEESIRKLDSSQVYTILNHLTICNIRYQITYFHGLSRVNKGKLFGLDKTPPKKFHFHWRRPSKNDRERHEQDRGFVKNLSSRIPCHFEANRPFFYAVFENHSLPIVMGVFTGN